MPLTREHHVHYTRNEFQTDPYFIAMIQFLKEQKIESILDLGSNVGEATNVFADHISTLKNFFMVEPQKDNFAFLQQNTRHLQNCKFYNVGIYYGATEAELYLDPHYPNVGGFVLEQANDPNVCPKHRGVGEKVKLTTLEELDIPMVDFVKMDIEGAEYNLLLNSSYLKNVKYIDFEPHTRSPYVPKVETAQKDIDEFLKQHFPSHRVIINGMDLGSNSGHKFLSKI
jgi:FkbM family methyltransferase